MTPALYSEDLPGGASWSGIVRRGRALRLVDLEGGANVAALLFRADQPLERYNMPDTLKAQFIARIAAPCVLYSDMGHVLASVVEDGCGWHDTFTGFSDAAHVAARFGTIHGPIASPGPTGARVGDGSAPVAGDASRLPGSYQLLRNGRHTNARDHFLTELGKYGLGERDLGPSINFFTRIGVDAAGRLAWDPANSPSGSAVTLRFEMDSLVVLSATPHPLDPARGWKPRPVRLEHLRLPAPAEDDPCRLFRAQNARGFELTDRLYL